MRITMKIIKLIPLSISLATLAFASSSWAAGTASGTNIDNTATINYSVGGAAQTEIESSEAGNSNPGSGNGVATTFKVDKKIDLLVTASTGTSVVPNTSGAPTSLSFTLKNEGNSTESFNLTPTQVASTGADDVFDTSSCTVTTPALPVSLTADESTNVTVQCTIPVSSSIVKNGAKSMVDLLAEESTGLTETGGADTAGSVDIVFADDTGTSTDAGNRNAKHSATNTYTINTADLTVMKTSAVTKMSINEADVTTDAKRIPGATIEYTIAVSNASGASTATGIVISDPIPADLSYVSCAVSGDGIGSCSQAAGTVTSAAFDLAAGETATLTITATVN
ncbi:MAG TPA: DUF11 domain-containing protein [Leucothrix mucor]|uniref:DUF11 domain-containing protein n=1 Tax=Leucothrix mucor TaxID=45248 RepID=A0A7V2T0B4_LEUMU|nr:DUF11 domain-containing protein [Leucothrix mucor]